MKFGNRSVFGHAINEFREQDKKFDQLRVHNLTQSKKIKEDIQRKSAKFESLAKERDKIFYVIRNK